MVRSRRYTPLLIAVILGVHAIAADAAPKRGKRAAAAAAGGAALAATAAVAASPAPGKPPASSPDREAAAASAADAAFLATRQAALQGSLERLEAAAPGVEPAMRSYVDYWRLRFRLTARGTPAGSEAAVDAEATAFIDRTDNPLLADLARRDWLQRLARRADWSAFERIYPTWVLRDEAALHCHGGVASLETGKPIGEEARDALFQPRELSEACGSLLERIAATPGAAGRDAAWRRLKLALEAGAGGSVRRIAPLLGLAPGAVEAALQRPAKVASPGASREVLVIALGTLARQDPEAAAGLTDAIAALPAAERAWVWSQIAAHSMRRLAPVPAAWLNHARTAQASDETWAWLTRAALRAGDWLAVHQFIDRMSPEGRRDPTWIYWDARAHQSLGRQTQAENGFRGIAGQFHFYGQLAAEEMGQPTTIPAPAAAPTSAEMAEASGNPGFARALRLYRMGLRQEANREWNFQLRGMPDRQLLAAASYACERRVLDRCVNTADRTRAEHDFSLRFVTPFRAQLEAAASERGLDAAWVYGLIRQESRFIMDARSSANAQGLMQIIPPTARWIARRLGVNDFRLEQLNELDTNLRFGTYYLRSVHDDLENSPLLASAGYNAGPNRPRQWRSTLPRPLEGAAFAEIIPFTETRDYVKKVLSNAAFYGALMTGQPQSLKQRLGHVVPVTMRASELP
jgi:soluble lytic murein transglycosylase